MSIQSRNATAISCQADGKLLNPIPLAEYLCQKLITLIYNSAVFQAGGLVVVLVEVVRKAYLASIVPVIVDAVLNEHQVVVDIVAFVSKGDFPRSRLGEKQRGKILASWVTRKLRTIAQFGIRDPDGADSQITEVAEPRSAVGSVRGVGSSLKNVETITEHPRQHPQQDFAPLPTGVSEMPTPYESSIVESPPLPPTEEDRDETPTEIRSNFADDAELYLHTPQDPPQDDYYSHTSHLSEPPEHAFQFSPPTYDNPLSSNPPLQPQYASTPILSRPLETTRPPFPPRQQSQEYSAGRGIGNGGGLRVANTTAAGAGVGDEEDEWPQEAIMHMNLGSGRQSQAGGYGGGGAYGHAL